MKKHRNIPEEANLVDWVQSRRDWVFAAHGTRQLQRPRRK